MRIKIATTGETTITVEDAVLDALELSEEATLAQPQGPDEDGFYPLLDPKGDAR